MAALVTTTPASASQRVPFVQVPCDATSLADAVAAANATPTVLRMASYCIYNITAQLPQISGDVALVGGPGTIIRHAPATAANFRLLDVGGTGRLRVVGITLRNGNPAGDGGGIRNAGRLVLNFVTLNNNLAGVPLVAGGNGGGPANLAGARAVVAHTVISANEALRARSSSLAATIPPPYGAGSLGFILGNTVDKIDFGNETIFAGLPLRDINVLKYWLYVGQDVPNLAGLPGISIESDPRAFGVGFTTLNYLPGPSSPPSRPPAVFSNTWQQFDASGAGSAWFPTSGTLQAATGCTFVAPCSFDVLKSKLPNAVVSLSIGISVGRNAIFAGAVDGLQINKTVYDFEPFGVRRTIPTPL